LENTFETPYSELEWVARLYLLNIDIMQMQIIPDPEEVI